MKRSSALMLFLFLLGFLSSCTDQTNQNDCCINIDLVITIELQNADGSDILNPSISGSLTEQDIDVYYEINGKLETYASLNGGAMLDNPKGFSVQSEESKYSLRVFSNPTAGNNVITLIRIKDRPEIKLVTQVEANHGKQITKLWYNDQLVWANSMSSKQYPMVTVKF